MIVGGKPFEDYAREINAELARQRRRERVKNWLLDAALCATLAIAGGALMFLWLLW